MIVILTLVSFLFGAATYFAEKDMNGESYDSILKATYWAILTIKSVAYGDMFPVTPIGRILACLCALFGAATIRMFVSVLVDRYQRVYNRKKVFPQQELFQQNPTHNISLTKFYRPEKISSNSEI
jgi:voltage-gated potassium channel